MAYSNKDIQYIMILLYTLYIDKTFIMHTLLYTNSHQPFNEKLECHRRIQNICRVIHHLCLFLYISAPFSTLTTMCYVIRLVWDHNLHFFKTLRKKLFFSKFLGLDDIFLKNSFDYIKKTCFFCREGTPGSCRVK